MRGDPNKKIGQIEMTMSVMVSLSSFTICRHHIHSKSRIHKRKYITQIDIVILCLTNYPSMNVFAVFVFLSL